MASYNWKISDHFSEISTRIDHFLPDQLSEVRKGNKQCESLGVKPAVTTEYGEVGGERTLLTAQTVDLSCQRPRELRQAVGVAHLHPVVRLADVDRLS